MDSIRYCSSIVGVSSCSRLGLAFKVAAMLSIAFVSATPAWASLDDEQQAEWAKRIKTAEVPGALGADLFGDSINYYNGQTSYSVTDIDLPGNNALPVRVARSRSTGDRDELSYGAAFGDWELDVPYMSGIYATGYPWQVQATTPTNRCSSGTMMPITVSGWTGSSYWRGSSINVPGYGAQSVRSNSGIPVPSDGLVTRWVTSKFWQFRCGIQLKNAGIDGFAGEGFVVLATDGTKYSFDWMTSRAVKSAVEQIPPITAGVKAYKQLPRVEVRIYATRVEDRFGNWVSYTYSGARLTDITASDGRNIKLDYNADGRIERATAGGKSWIYSYPSSTSAVPLLQSVTLPNGTAWQYNFPSDFKIKYNVSEPAKAPKCDQPGWMEPEAQTRTVSITHPSGALGEFTFTSTRHGRTLVDNNCPQPGDDQNPYGFYAYGPPILTDNFAITSKKISGAGLSSMAWSMAYSAAVGTSLQDGGGSPSSASVTVKNPDASSTIYTFGIQWFINEGKLLKTQKLSPAGTVMEEISSDYAVNPVDAPYPHACVPSFTKDDFADACLVPRTRTVTTINGDTFSNTVNSFDNFAREVSVTRSNSTGASRTDITAYYDDNVRWVLGQVKSSTNSNTGIIEKATDYDATYAKPWKVYSYGLLQATLSYNTDGTLASVEDPLNRKAQFLNWKRGAPQQITLPDTVNKYVAINDLGWITSTTDGRGYSTSYEHDGVGRLAKVTYPTGDPQTWAPKNISYVQLTTAEQGIPAGSWRARSTEGRLQISTYYDALWRPVLAHGLTPRPTKPATSLPATTTPVARPLNPTRHRRPRRPAAIGTISMRWAGPPASAARTAPR